MTVEVPHMRRSGGSSSLGRYQQHAHYADYAQSVASRARATPPPPGTSRATPASLFVYPRAAGRHVSLGRTRHGVAQESRVRRRGRAGRGGAHAARAARQPRRRRAGDAAGAPRALAQRLRHLLHHVPDVTGVQHRADRRVALSRQAVAGVVEGGAGSGGGRQPAGAAGVLAAGGAVGQPRGLGARAAAGHAGAVRAGQRAVRAAAPHAPARALLDDLRALPRRRLLSEHRGGALLPVGGHAGGGAHALRGLGLARTGAGVRGGPGAAGGRGAARAGLAVRAAGRAGPAAAARHVHGGGLDQRAAGHRQLAALPALLLQGALHRRARGHDRAGEGLREGSPEEHEAGPGEQLDAGGRVLRAGVQLRAAGDAGHVAHHGPVRVEQAPSAGVHGRAHVGRRRARLPHLRCHRPTYQAVRRTRAVAVGRVPADGAGVRVLHPVGPGRPPPGAGGRRRGGRRVPGAGSAVVPHLARAHADAVPARLRLRLRRLLARRHAHTDHLLQGAGPASAGRVDGRADGRGLPVARAGARVRGGGVRAPRAPGHLRRHGRAHLRRAAGAAPRVLAAAAPPAACRLPARPGARPATI